MQHSHSRILTTVASAGWFRYSSLVQSEIAWPMKVCVAGSSDCSS